MNVSDGDDQDLAELLAELKDNAAARDLVVFDGLPVFPRESNEVAHPYAMWDGDTAAFLDLAAKVDARIIYLTETIFDRDDELRKQVEEAGYRGSIDEDEEPIGDPETGSAPWLFYRLQEQTEDWAEFDGSMSEVFCVWMKDGVEHLLLRFAPWQSEFKETVANVVADAREVTVAERRLRPSEEATRLHRLADEMVHHPRFSEASSEAKREFMAEQLYAEESPLTWRHIATRAAMIYWWDVEPAERASRAARICDLYDQGESIRNIGAILRLSEAKIRMELGDRISDRARS